MRYKHIIDVAESAIIGPSVHDPDSDSISSQNRIPAQSLSCMIEFTKISCIPQLEHREPRCMIMKLWLTSVVWLSVVLCSVSAVIADTPDQSPTTPGSDTSPKERPQQYQQATSGSTGPGQVGSQPQQGMSGGTITLKIETDTEKDRQSRLPEIVKSFSELFGAIAWPTVFVVLLLTQRRELTQLLASVIDVIGKSTRVKLGEIIDVEVDRSAKKAEQTPLPQNEIPPEEREAATRVDKLVGDSELPLVRQKMLEFAHEYEAIRSSLKPGPERTRAMNAIVAKMRTLALAAKPFLSEFAADVASPGKRLAAIAILQLSPSLEYVPWLVSRMAEEQPFVFFHASLALIAAVRAFGARDSGELKSAVEQAMQMVNSFKGGGPDPNTVKILKQASSELSQLSSKSESPA